MTRKSRREIERTVEQINPEGENDDLDPILTFYQDPVTGEYYDSDREPLSKEEFEAACEKALMAVEISRDVVIPREQAEREGRTIAEEANVAADDHVIVRPEWMD